MGVEYKYLGHHQPRAIEKAENLPGLALFFSVGLGKTFTTIRILCNDMNKAKRLQRVVIFTKVLVVPQWEEEWLKFSNIKLKDITLLQGSQKKRVEDFKRLCGTGHIFVTNTEALLMQDLLTELVKWAPEAVVFDECHDLKNPEAKRSDAAYDLANPFDRKAKVWLPKPKTILLSGSPVLSSPLDIFQQVAIMLGGFPTRPYFETGDRQYLIQNFYHFRNRFFRDRNAAMPKEKHFPNWQPMTLEKDGYDSLGELSFILQNISVYATKWTCPELNLPPEKDVTIECSMTEHQTRVYKDMKKDLIAYVQSDRAATASLAIVKSLRLLQIVSGFVSTQGRGEEDDVADLRFDGTEKDLKLERIIRDVAPSEKILIWAVWRENYGNIRRICEKVGVDFVEVHGGISSERKKLENVQTFKTKDRCRIFIGHPGSSGTGLNLTMGSQDIFYSRNFSTLHFVQARGRNHRAGQTKRVIHNNLTCQGTIDDTVLLKLSQNLAMAENLLDPEKKTLSYKDVANELARE